MTLLVREDYSANGDAWSREFCQFYQTHTSIAKELVDFPHEHARSRTFRWGEDGIAGVSDTHGLQNVAFAFWNEEE